MSIKDMMQDMISEYIDGFSIDQHLNSTLKQLGIDSLDAIEIAYNIGEKLDLRSGIPDELNLGQIIEHLEMAVGGKNLENA
jgi:acyl carrier protein